jgi:NTP pyrophosphatase (non-canonical NTP hydrolase)
MNITSDGDLDFKVNEAVHLTPLSEVIFEGNKRNGFWNEPRNLGELLMLITSELAEGLEADRKKRREVSTRHLDTLLKMKDDAEFKTYFQTNVKDTLPDELADALIRILDMCGGMNIDISKHVFLKLKYNSMRGHKHGKSY